MADFLRVSQTWVAVLGGNTGKLRPSHTWVAALGGNTGKLRITQQWVAVLVPALDISVFDTLAITDTVHSNILTPLVTDTLALTDLARSNIQSYSLANAINLTQVARSNIQNISVANTLELDDDVHVNMASPSITDPMSITHHTEALNTKITVAHDINLIDQAFADQAVRNLSLSTLIDLDETVFQHFGVANLSIVHAMDGSQEEIPLLFDQANLVFDIEIIDTLLLTDEVFRTIAVVDSLNLNQAVLFSFGLLIEDTLELEDEALINGEYQQLVSNDIGVEDFITYIIVANNDACTYGLFIGQADDPDFEPPPATPPTLGTATLTLTWPYVTPTSTLVLRNPEFGNSESLAFTRIIRETRGGTLEVYGDPDWPQTTTLSITVDGLPGAIAEDFLQFLEDSLGQEIGLLDWENRQWRGIITTPDAEVTDHGKACRRSITFEFEGETV